MKIPEEMLKEIRESGYDKRLVYTYIRELLDNYLLDKDLKEPTAEIVMAAELIDSYLGDKRFMRELEDRDEYDAA